MFGLVGIALVAAACGGGAQPVAQPAAPEGPPASERTSAAIVVEAPSDPIPTAAPAVVPTVTPEPVPIAAPVTSQEPSPAAESGRRGDEKVAPELAGISGWLNAEPFTLESHRGKVVLIDFWTYTCINCIRTFPFLRDWHEKYADQGLVIVGVHTPEFDFEKIKENVAEAAGGFGLEYAIVQDNDYETWNAFRNRSWPAKYLIDKDGYIRYTHFGEGDYAETEQKIRELLDERGSSVSDIVLNLEPERVIDPGAFAANRMVGITRELYAGVERNYGAAVSGSIPPYVRHDDYYREPDADMLYEDPGDHINHFLYLRGLWHNGKESLTHARETESYEDYLVIRFFATSVNVVMSPEGGEPYEVRITMDGRPLKSEDAGADVMIDEEFHSFVLVEESRMYRLVDLPEFGAHDLRLSSNSDEFSVFAYTFGAYMK
jgi:thiol-disulfide isomerase/thioredoxin